jgi:thioredoxin 1
MADKITYLNSENFSSEVEQFNGLVLVDFFAEWCGPCRMLSPIMEELADEIDKAKICKINTDDSPEIASKYNISGIPAVLLFKNGKVVENAVGFRPKNAYIELIEKNL